MKTTTIQMENVIQDTRKYIINTARRFFSEYGYLGVSMSDIAQKLNITKTALYYYFTGKVEIYIKVLDEVFSDLNISITEALNESTPNKKLHNLIKKYLEFGLKEKNLIKALAIKLPSSDSHMTRRVVNLREQVADLIQPVIKEVLVSKNIAKKIDSHLLTSLLTSMMDGLLLEYSFFNKKIDSGRVASQIIEVLF